MEQSKLTAQELAKMEDAYDMVAYDEAMEEYNSNPVTYPHEETREILFGDDK